MQNPSNIITSKLVLIFISLALITSIELLLIISAFSNIPKFVTNPFSTLTDSTKTSRRNAATRTGIPIPPDVAAFGRAIVHNMPNQTLVMELWLPGLNSSEICCSFRNIGAHFLHPMLVILAPKNHLVRIWEHRTFNTHRKKKLIKDFDLIQRAYRLICPADTSNSVAKYSGQILQITVPRKDDNKPEEANLPFAIPIEDHPNLSSVQDKLDNQMESSWIFNWDKFPELYNLAHDYSTYNGTKFV